MSRTLLTVLAAVALICTSETAGAWELKPFSQYQMGDVRTNTKPAIVLMTSPDCQDCKTVRKLFDNVDQSRFDFDFYIDDSYLTQGGGIIIRFAELPFYLMGQLETGALDSAEKVNNFLNEQIAFFQKVKMLHLQLREIEVQLAQLTNHRMRWLKATEDLTSQRDVLVETITTLHREYEMFAHSK